MEEPWLKMLPQGAAVTAVVLVVGMILLRYIPSLIKEFRDTVQGIVTTHAATQKEERDMYRVELKELRTLFSDGIKSTTEGLGSRIDGLTESHRDLRDSVKDLRSKLEK